jgi:hypothetical protein
MLVHVVKQGTLAGPRLTVQDQHSALPGLDLPKQSIQYVSLAMPAEQLGTNGVTSHAFPPGSGAYRAVFGLRIISHLNLCRFAA